MDGTLLCRLRDEGKLVEFRRDLIDENSVLGFLYSVTDEFVVVSRVGERAFDGVTILRVEDLTRLRWGTRQLEAWTRLLSESPTAPEPAGYIDLTSWETIVESVGARERAIAFYREQVEEDACYVGADVVVRGGAVEARGIGPTGELDGWFAIDLEQVTRIDFGGGQTRNLASLAALVRRERRA